MGLACARSRLRCCHSGRAGLAGFRGQASAAGEAGLPVSAPGAGPLWGGRVPRVGPEPRLRVLQSRHLRQVGGSFWAGSLGPSPSESGHCSASLAPCVSPSPFLSPGPGGACAEDRDLGVQTATKTLRLRTWVRILPLPLNSCVALGNRFGSLSPFPHSLPSGIEVACSPGLQHQPAS